MTNEQPTLSPPPEFARPPKILIVDDIAENLQVLRGRLRIQKYDVVEASGGKEALDVLRAALLEPSGALPDLLLLDVQMPDVNGFEVCKTMKTHDELRNIPVIFLTARGEIDDVVEGFKTGAVDYIVKPFQATELLTRVKTHLELKFARDALQQKNALLAKLNEEKTEFLNIAAHDLKNPLASVRWITDSLRDERLTPEERRERLDKIALAVERMFRLVKTFLDVNALEQTLADIAAPAQNNDALLRLAPKRTNIVFAAAGALENFAEQARNKQIETSFSNAAHNAAVALSEEIAGQILDNLISNAVKYTPRGGRVAVSVFNAGGAYTAVSVADSGSGIPPNEAQRLFSKYGVLSTKPTAGEDSTGLGLFIVKKLLDAVGGTIEYRRSEQGGAVFTAYFPSAQTLTPTREEDEFKEQNHEEE
jgi:two-component system sensor histidine kinase/response regulator